VSVSPASSTDDPPALVDGQIFLIKGEREQLDKMVASEEFDKLVTRALFIVEHFGVVNASFGGRVQKLLGSFQADTADLLT
jgi:hypothetical protein